MRKILLLYVILFSLLMTIDDNSSFPNDRPFPPDPKEIADVTNSLTRYYDIFTDA